MTSTSVSMRLTNYKWAFKSVLPITKIANNNNKNWFENKGGTSTIIYCDIGLLMKPLFKMPKHI